MIEYHGKFSLTVRECKIQLCDWLKLATCFQRGNLCQIQSDDFLFWLNCSLYCLIFLIVWKFQQDQVMCELQSYANPDQGPQPEDHAAVMSAHKYLKACSQIFEFGFLNTDRRAKIYDVNDSVILSNIQQGFSFFQNWCEQLIREGMYCNHFAGSTILDI